MKINPKLTELWNTHAKEWRDPAQVTSQWQEAVDFDNQLLRYTVQGDFCDILAELKITLLVTREYEHLVMAIGHSGKNIDFTFQPIPHPSGLAVDRKKNIVYIASTRNPNQIYEYEPVTRKLKRQDQPAETSGNPLIPVRSRYYPGCMYFHDLALLDNTLYANAVAHNAIVKLDDHGSYERIWWPKCLDDKGDEAFTLNYLQLNSIAGENNFQNSFFSASTDRVLLKRRPGQKSFSVDKRGVIFSAETREPYVTGLTRPHSARIHHNKLWVDNSGYGEFGYCENGQLQPITTLSGWTRGLCLIDNIAFVGTSRVIPKFSHYAPGLIVEKSRCGIHAIDITTGRILGSLLWPYGNQIFAIDWISRQHSTGFPFKVGKRATQREKQLFYAFETQRIHSRS